MPDYKKKRKHYGPIRKKKRYDNDEDFSVNRDSKVEKEKDTKNDITPPRLVKGKKQKLLDNILNTWLE